MPRSTSFPKNKIRVLLLEGVHAAAVARLRAEGYDVQVELGALDEDALLAAIGEVHVLGIRSTTEVTPRVLKRARRLLASGTFCIGTNQVAVDAARAHGVPVFNAPHANTRSVAELVIGFVVMLLRGLYEKIEAAHQGRWLKSAAGSREVRGKAIGIIGYGHIGQQVSVLAEALGMQVLYYDVVDKLALGNARRVGSLGELLAHADVVTCHVPGNASTRGLIGAAEFGSMKDGAFLVNTSRGSVVDLDALAAALDDGRLAGAALDVFPEEPKSAQERFSVRLQGRPEVLLTPHIGGSTVEAQRGIGEEVAEKLTRFVNNGSTQGAVNFPEVVLPELVEHHRILHVHRNVPGVLQEVNTLFGRSGVNVAAQVLRTLDDVGYLIMDTDRSSTREMVRELRGLPHTIKARPLF
jgi:D-3-phosphoglycerate dehydrogenase / 2-oxoglutarate reductase